VYKRQGLNFQEKYLHMDGGQYITKRLGNLQVMLSQLIN
jgi:hypothetical protein